MKDRKSEPLGASVVTIESKRKKTKASLNRDIQAKIGKQLRAYYAGLIEPIPDRFADLLRQFDNSDHPDGRGDRESSE
jgi:hypothetical protein